MSSKNYLLGVCVLFLFFVPQLEAKFLITYGESFAKVADLDQEVKDYFNVEAGDIELSYRYEQFGIFWLEIWSWSGEYCVYSPGQHAYLELTPEDVQYVEEKMPGALSVPTAYSFPTGLIIIIIVAVIAIVSSRQGGGEQAEIPGEEGNA